MHRRTLLTTALAAPWLAPVQRPAQDALLDAARREGGLSWYNGYIGDTVAQDMVGRFERAYPGVRLSTIRSTSQVAFQRLRQDQAGRAAQLRRLQQQRHLPFRRPRARKAAAGLHPGERGQDPAGACAARRSTSRASTTRR